MRTERLTLRRYGPQDFGSFLALVVDPAVMAPVGGPDGVPAAGSLFERVLAPGTLEPDRTWAVGRTYVGHAWLSASEDPVPKLGFALLEAVWVRGLGVEVASALLTHAHNTLGLAIIAAAVPPERPVP